MNTTEPTPGLVRTPLFSSSRDSYVREAKTVRAAGMEPASETPVASQPPAAGPYLLAAAIEGRLPDAAPDSAPMRAIVVGDSDFASNSFLPYLANSDLALAMTRWLLREERLTTVPTRIPVPPMIVLSNTQMKVIFLLIALVLPLLAVALGLLTWWRRR